MTFLKLIISHLRRLNVSLWSEIGLNYEQITYFQYCGNNYFKEIITNTFLRLLNKNETPNLIDFFS